jgi:hypothetical protein
MKHKLCIFVLLLCIAYGSARFVYLRSSTWTTEPIQKGIIHFAKDMIKAINPKNLLKDIGEGANDVVDR